MGRTVQRPSARGSGDGLSGAPAWSWAESARVRTMQVWLRLLVVCLVALALPVQGMAGVSLTHCGPSHGRMAAVLETSHHHGEGADTDGSHAHAAATPHRADAVAQAGAPHGEPQPGSLDDLAKFKCSSCSACCASAALPSTMPQLPQLDLAPAVFADSLLTVARFATDGPDRPPRG